MTTRVAPAESAGAAELADDAAEGTGVATEPAPVAAKRTRVVRQPAGVAVERTEVALVPTGIDPSLARVAVAPLGLALSTARSALQPPRVVRVASRLAALQARFRRQNETVAAGLGSRHPEALLRTAALQSAIFNSANFSSIATDAKEDDRKKLSGYVRNIVDKGQLGPERFASEIRRAMSGRQLVA